MRTFLDWIYRAGGVVAAVCLIGICLIVVTQVAFRMLDEVLDLATGQRLGLIVPSAAEFSGFLLAGASFLALAHTLRHGGHIRVSLFVQKLGSGAQHAVEVWSLALATALSGFYGWHTALLVYDSWRYHEVSYGIIPVPLWIPQSAMLLGLAVLAVAFADDLVRVLGRRDPSYAGAEEGLLGEDSDLLHGE